MDSGEEEEDGAVRGEAARGVMLEEEAASEEVEGRRSGVESAEEDNGLSEDSHWSTLAAIAGGSFTAR